MTADVILLAVPNEFEVQGRGAVKCRRTLQRVIIVMIGECAAKTHALLRPGTECVTAHAVRHEDEPVTKLDPQAQWRRREDVRP